MKTMPVFLTFIAAVCLLTACGRTSSSIKIYGWTGEPGDATEQSIHKDFALLKSRGFDGVCHGAEANVEKNTRAARIAHANGLEYHAWLTTMLNGNVDSAWYAVNRKGESAYRVQAYVPYYKFLCPGKEEVFHFLDSVFGAIAGIPEVDYIHLDYIRFPDVILARGLWEKYGLVMHEEYPVADYCYCDHCTAGFKAVSGIDIRSVEDPSACEEWKEFRYNQITGLVNRLAAHIHAKGKKVSAAVFPGPTLAKKLVRQEWDKWDIDAFFPMNYNDFYLEGPEWLADITQEEVSAVNGKAPVYSGLFICHDWQDKANMKDPENHGLTPAEIEEAVSGSLRSGAGGICLFTPQRMTEEHWKALEKAIRK
jgi:hypothetical protein